MNMTTTHSNAPMNGDDLHNYNPVNESLATDLNFPQPSIKGKVFSTADLWKLRKQRKNQGAVVR